MSNKNPFEIRLDLIQMAKDYLDAQAKVNTDFATKVFSEMVANGRATTEQWQNFVPAQYTIKDITDKANELYGFIVKNK
jgi:hypothetical protein